VDTIHVFGVKLNETIIFIEFKTTIS